MHTEYNHRIWKDLEPDYYPNLNTAHLVHHKTLPSYAAPQGVLGNLINQLCAPSPTGMLHVLIPLFVLAKGQTTAVVAKVLATMCMLWFLVDKFN